MFFVNKYTCPYAQELEMNVHKSRELDYIGRLDFRENYFKLMMKQRHKNKV